MGHCNPLCCAYRCACACVMQILCFVLVILGVFALILWLVFRPEALNYTVTGASLSEFNLSQASTLSYNLAINMDFANPNKRLGVYYDAIEVAAKYEDQVFASTTLQPFFQDMKNTTSINGIVLKGQNLLLLGNIQVMEYNKDKNAGVYHIEIKLGLSLRFLFAWSKSKQVNPKIHCYLRVPLQGNNNGRSSNSFVPTQCGFDW